jgi:hypothetical protein
LKLKGFMGCFNGIFGNEICEIGWAFKENHQKRLLLMNIVVNFLKQPLLKYYILLLLGFMGCFNGIFGNEICEIGWAFKVIRQKRCPGSSVVSAPDF